MTADEVERGKERREVATFGTSLHVMPCAGAPSVRTSTFTSSSWEFWFVFSRWSA